MLDHFYRHRAATEMLSFFAGRATELLENPLEPVRPVAATARRSLLQLTRFCFQKVQSEHQNPQRESPYALTALMVATLWGWEKNRNS